MVPYDVLVDPLSLPKHPVIEDKHNAHQVIHEDSAQNSDEEEVIMIQLGLENYLFHSKELFWINMHTCTCTVLILLDWWAKTVKRGVLIPKLGTNTGLFDMLIYKKVLVVLITS